MAQVCRTCARRSSDEAVACSWLPRAFRALGNETVVIVDGTHPTVEVGVSASPVLGDPRCRATNVPCTAVRTRLQGTATDSAEATRPAPFHVLPGDDPARSGFASRGSQLLAVLDRGAGLTVSRESPLDYGLAVSRL